MRLTYLDNAATTAIPPEVFEAVKEGMTTFGNPSSLHRLGIDAERLVERARGKVAGVIGAEKRQVFFVSGGTEGNNLAIRGAAEFLASRGKHIITTAIEHPAVLATCKAMEERGFRVTFLPVNNAGVVDPAAIEAELTEDTVLVSVMMVNNEVGSIQPVSEIGKILAERPNTFFHVDAIQALGKIPVNVEEINADFLVLSAHKVHGPKGVGSIFVRNPDRLVPQITGGGQERNIRSGTENVPGISGFGRAVEILPDSVVPMRDLKLRLAEGLGTIPDTVVNGPAPNESVPHILNVSFPGVRGEVLVHALETHGIFVSTGSACSSRKVSYSHVLRAMGISEKRAEGSIRFSLSHFTTPEDIDYTLERLEDTVRTLRAFQRR